MKKFSQIKHRIRQFASSQGINLSEVYAKTGLVDGTLSNSSGITEDNLLKFFSKYSYVNANWLLTGEGEMLKDSNENSGNIINVNSELQNKLIAIQEKEIARLEKELTDIKSLQKPVREAKGSSTAGVAKSEEKLIR